MHIALRVSSIFGLALALASADASAGPGQEQVVSANDFGGVGLLQTRTARMAPEGSFELGAVAVEPYRGFYILTQPLPWLELNFRSVDIANVRRDGSILPLEQVPFMENLWRFKGGGTITDRSLDLKIRVLEESKLFPAIAIGAQDILGRAGFGGEYLVAGKRIGALDFSFGLGWGYLGSRNHVGNPFSLFGDGFRRRSADEGRGTFNPGSYFAGRRLAFFGGVAWETPLDGLSLKVEYSGADPAFEPFGNSLREEWPVNFGVNYRPYPWLDMAVGFERGNSVMLRTAVRFDMFDLPRAFRDKAHKNTIPDVPQAVAANGASVAVFEEEERPQFDMRLAAYLDEAGLSGAYISHDVLALSLIIPKKRTLSAFDEQALANGLFKIMPPSMDSVWISHTDDMAGDARLYRRRDRAVEESAAVLALPDDMKNMHFSSLALISGDIRFTSDDTSAPDITYSDDVLRALPPDIRRIDVRNQKNVQLLARDLTVDRARAQAATILASVPESVAVASLDIRGGTKAILKIDAPDGDRVDGGQIADSADLDHAVVIATGYETAAIFEHDADRLFRCLRDADIVARAMAWDRGRLTVWIDTPYRDEEAQLIGRTARILARETPGSVEAIAIRRGLGDTDVIETRLLKRDILKALAGQGSPEEIWLTTVVETPPSTEVALDQRYKNPSAYPGFDWGVAPVVLQHFGNSDSGMWLADINLDLLASLRVAPGLELSGAVRRFVAGNLDRITADGTPGALPVVRSDVRRFIEEGRTSIPYLQADYRFGLGDAVYGRVSAGIFEQMYAGISGEVLYTPYDRDWAYGVELNWVKRRDEDQLFGLSGGDRLTGDISLYREWPGGVRMIVRGGRFLGGDWGGGLDLSRRFDNGVRIGGYMALSDKSDDEFGALSPNKGIYITIPLASFWPFGGPRTRFTTGFDEMSRDSGQRLQMNGRLYDRLDIRNRNRLAEDWMDILH